MAPAAQRDIVIIGGGLAGLTLAYALLDSDTTGCARPRLTLIDDAPFPGLGQTRRAVGLIPPHPLPMPGRGAASQLQRWLGLTRTHLQALDANPRAPFKLRRTPCLWPLGSRGEGYLVESLQLLDTLFFWVDRWGCDIRTRTEVENIAWHENDTRHRVTIPDGNILTHVVVLSPGPRIGTWALAPLADQTLQGSMWAHDTILPLHLPDAPPAYVRFMEASTARDDSTASHISTAAPHHSTTVRGDIFLSRDLQDRSLYIRREYLPMTGLPRHPARTGLAPHGLPPDRPPWDSLLELTETASRRLGVSPKALVDHSWCCLDLIGRDGAPLVGPLAGADGVYGFGAFGGDGLLYALGAAREMAPTILTSAADA